MLNLNGVTKKFRSGVVAVSDFTLDLKPGVLGLLGPNGAGKTTLMQMIAALTKPTSGTIRFEDRDVVREPDYVRQRLGYLPQDFGVYDTLNAAEFLGYFAALKGVRNRNRVTEVLELVNLHTVAGRAVGTYSGGMKQRLGIAQALLNEPRLLIVDEPTAGLDPEERVRFRNILSEIGFGKLVILSTHIVSDVESIASSIAIIKGGRLVVHGSPEDLLSAAQGRVWRAVLPSDRFEIERSRLRISSALRKPDGVHIRVVHPERPFAGAEPAEPDLEDAFIFVMNYRAA